MSFAASTIPAFTAALKAGLEATLPAGSFVCDGPAPSAVLNEAEVIELLDVDGDQEVKLLNRTTQPRLEDMEMTVLITVIHETADKQTIANTRAFEIFDSLNQLLRTDPSLSTYYTGPGRIYGTRITRVKHTKRTSPNNDAREAGIEAGVRWEAKI